MIGRTGGKASPERGLTFIELLVVVTVLAVLASLVIPLARWDEKRRREEQLRMALRTMREAIDTYRTYCEQGLIVQTDVEQEHYPRDLDEMVDGVDVAQRDSPDSKKVRFLLRIPIDPFTETPEWGKRSYQDDWDSDSWGEENLYDVYSLSPGVALDGTEYKDW